MRRFKQTFFDTVGILEVPFMAALIAVMNIIDGAIFLSWSFAGLAVARLMINIADYRRTQAAIAEGESSCVKKCKVK